MNTASDSNFSDVTHTWVHLTAEAVRLGKIQNARWKEMTNRHYHLPVKERLQQRDLLA